MMLDIAANEQHLAKDHTVLILIPANYNWSSNIDGIGGIISKGLTAVLKDSRCLLTFFVAFRE